MMQGTYLITESMVVNITNFLPEEAKLVTLVAELRIGSGQIIIDLLKMCIGFLGSLVESGFKKVALSLLY